MISISEKLKFFSTTLSQMPFARNLDIKVIDIHQNLVVLEMTIVTEKHANLLGVVHGGVLMSLADTAMGFACANLGSVPTTIDMNINFLKSIKVEGPIRATASVLHYGSHIMVAEAEVYGLDKALAAKARGTFFAVGKLDEFKNDEGTVE